MEQLISEFLNYLKFERNRSLHTIANYKLDLTLFANFARHEDETITWQVVDADIVRKWMEVMMDSGSRATTILRRLSSLRSFFRFAMVRGYVEKDPVYHLKGPKKAKPLPQYLQEQEMDKLLGEDFWTDSFADCRARTIILTFYSTGMRLSELTNLDDSSVDFSSFQLKVLGKRNKERIIPFGEELANTLKDYIKKRNKEIATSSPALFVTDKGMRMKSWQVREIVRRNLSKVTTMKKRSPHVLRHTFATAMLNNSADLESIRALLGHESISTTEIYTHTTFEQLQKVYRDTHPRGENNDEKTKTS